ncbi:MAG: phospholipid carrier-dependent glycosyltransferase, partial [Candidatus Promineifilaceae bacterium]|nr:phospholipid carrier-dependent glycosyltransferase [Candidatus Promineifilaceae bacterium]
MILAAISFGALTYQPFFDSNNPISSNDYHPDEGVWIAVGKESFQRYFIERDWSYESWEDGRFGDFGTHNPTIGKYIIGAALFLSGAADEATVFPGYEFSNGLIWDEVKDIQPPPEALQAARAAMRWLAVLSTICIYFLGKSLTQSRSTGLVVGILFTLKPLVITSGRRAMMEMPLLFFSLLSLLLGFHLLEAIRLGRHRWVLGYAIGFGIILGLVISTKLSAVLVLVTVVLWSGSNLVRKYSMDSLGEEGPGLNSWSKSLWVTLLALALAIGLALLIF